MRDTGLPDFIGGGCGLNCKRMGKEQENYGQKSDRKRNIGDYEAGIL